jgi:hypothetical protein
MIDNSGHTIKALLRKAHEQKIGDGFLPFWAGMLAEVLEPVDLSTSILEFGSTNSKFLQLAYLASPYKAALGIVLDVDGIKGFEKWIPSEDIACRFISESAIEEEAVTYDLAFSHEVFSLLPDLDAHANVAWHLLTTDGVYYAGFGWHSDNPHSSRQAKIRIEKGLPFYSHSLDSVAEIFYRAGFEVGYKRLPIPYFMVYDPTLVSRRFGSVAEMIACLQDHKVLFSFRKRGREHAKV